MKPWPEELQRRYPCAPGALPERPWWLRDRGVLTRTDMRGALIPLGFGSPTAADGVRVAEMEDALAPLPHPGFRVGQVWAWPLPGGGFGEVVLGWRVDGLGWSVGWRECSTSQLPDLLADAYLIADPCCPWLAPWAPAEGAKP